MKIRNSCLTNHPQLLQKLVAGTISDGAKFQKTVTAYIRVHDVCFSSRVDTYFKLLTRRHKYTN